MNASVIVCTHNRAESLARTIMAVSQQKMFSGKFEIVVIDNASTDHTKSMVLETAKETTSCSVRYYFEPKLGLSCARNTGVFHSVGEILFFIDDDAVPRDSWLQHLIDAFSDVEIGVAGGDVYPVWPNGCCPYWLHSSLQDYIGLVQFPFSQMTDLNYPDYPFGVNIAFRKSAIASCGGFSSRLGRSGDSLLSGEETELCARIQQIGLRVVYVPDAAVNHIIAEQRLSKQWFRKRADIQGVSKVKIEFVGERLLRKGYLFLKRVGILLVSGMSFFLATIANKRFAFMCECKMRMSWAYLVSALKSHQQSGDEVS